METIVVVVVVVIILFVVLFGGCGGWERIEKQTSGLVFVVAIRSDSDDVMTLISR